MLLRSVQKGMKPVLKILITGGSGFIGTNLVEYYKAAGFTVTNFDIIEPRNIAHIDAWRDVDLLDRKNLAIAIAEVDPDVVFHMAARTDLNGSNVSDYDVNTKGLDNLIFALNGLDSLKSVVFASSMLVCKVGYVPSSEIDYCPDTPYGESKVLGEELIRNSESRFPWTIVRPTSIWGPWFASPYRDFFKTVSNNCYFHPRGFRVRRSYGFVYNTIYQLDRISRMVENRLAGDTIYLADYKPIELKSWADKIQESLGVWPVKQVPLRIFKILAKLGDFAKFLGMKNPPMTSFRLNNMLTEMVHDTSKLERYCGPTPYSMSDGVDITCEWLVKSGNKL